LVLQMLNVPNWFFLFSLLSMLSMDWFLVSSHIIFKKDSLSFRRIFGVSPDTCTFLWALLFDSPIKIKAVHLLWTLYFFRLYPTQIEQECFLGVDHKTFNFYIWAITEILYKKLDLVSTFLTIFIDF
jgi:hypothetical protein